MSTSVIIDNWALQDIGHCLVDGLASGTASEIQIDVGHDSHSFGSVPHAGIQIEALLDFLVDVVLRDSMYVDSSFTYVWEKKSSVFAPVMHPGLLQAAKFLEHETVLAEPRKLIVAELCVTSSIRKIQKENEASWLHHKKAANPFMSAVVWGAAGFLSRSHVFEAPYHGHPSRNRLLEQTMFKASRRDAVQDTVDWIAAERLKIFQVSTSNWVSRRATIILPPLAVEIIDEANDVSELIAIAYQKRDKYKKLREWLREIQSGFDSDSAKRAAAFKKTLKAISRDLDATLGLRNDMPVSLEMSYEGPSVGIEIPVMSGIRKRFGVSAILNRMLIADRGANSIKRLLRLFGERGQNMEMAVVSYLQRVSAKTA